METFNTQQRGGNGQGSGFDYTIKLTADNKAGVDANGRNFIIGDKVSGKPEFDAEGNRVFKPVKVYVSYDKGPKPDRVPLLDEAGLSQLKINNRELKKAPDQTRILHISGCQKVANEEGIEAVEARRVSVTGNSYEPDYNLAVTHFQKGEQRFYNVMRLASGRAELAVMSGTVDERREKLTEMVKAVADKLGDNEGITIMINGGKEGADKRTTVQSTVSRFEGVKDNSRKLTAEELVSKILLNISEKKSLYTFDGGTGANFDSALMSSAGAAVAVVPSERVQLAKQFAIDDYQFHPGVGKQGYAISHYEFENSSVGKFLGASALEATGSVAPLKNLNNKTPVWPINDSYSFNRLVFAHQNLNGLSEAVVRVKDGEILVAGQASAAQASSAAAAPAAQAAAEPAAEPVTAGALADGDFDFDQEDPFKHA